MEHFSSVFQEIVLSLFAIKHLQSESCFSPSRANCKPDNTRKVFSEVQEKMVLRKNEVIRKQRIIFKILVVFVSENTENRKQNEK